MLFRSGGEDGKPGAVRLASGVALKARGVQTIPPGGRLIVEMPGGGGLGSPAERDPALIAADVANGFISEDEAHGIYKNAAKEPRP